MDTPEDRYARLTDEEKRVLELLALGRSAKEIAEELAISPVDVRRCVKNIFEKLGVHSRLEAMAYALNRPNPPTA